MLETVKTYLSGDAAKRAYRTFLQAFIPLLLLAVLGLLNGMLAWASNGEPFPDTQAFLMLVVVAAISGLIAVTSYVQNLWEGRGTDNFERFLGS